MSNNSIHEKESQGLPQNKLRRDLVSQFPEEDRLLILEIMSQMDESDLSEESLSLALAEAKLLGAPGSNLLKISRQNEDLRANVKQQKGYTKYALVIISILLVVIFLLLSLFAVYPKYSVVQTTDNSVICEISPKDNPMLTDVAIQDFAKMAVLSVYTFDYINYREQINDATTRYFTSDGRAGFNKALRTSGALSHIISNTLIMKALATNVPQIEEKGIDNNGRNFWLVKMPVITEFYAGQPKPVDVQRFIARARIVTEPRDAFNTKGLGVDSLTLRPVKE